MPRKAFITMSAPLVLTGAIAACTSCSRDTPATAVQDVTRGQEGDRDGHLDRVGEKVIEGWAWLPNSPEERLVVVVYDGEREIGSSTATIYREDLEKSGKGDGRYKFSVPTPADLRDGKAHVVHAFVREPEFELKGSPQTVTFTP